MTTNNSTIPAMSETESKFIGNSTLLDALYCEYSKPLHHWNGGRLEIRVTSEQRRAMEEMAQRLDDDMLIMAGGVEAVGHFLASAADNESGFSTERVANIGWFLEYLGKQINAHRHVKDCVTSELALSTIIEPE